MMNKNLLAGLFLSINTLALAQERLPQERLPQDDAAKYAASITPSDLKKHLVIIASDSLEGRDTGSPGQKKAAEYVSKYYKQYGLQPIAADADGSKSYLQKYKLYKRSWGEVYVSAHGKKYEFNKDFYLNGLLDVLEEVTTDLVSVGYGIEDGSYSDYAKINVKGQSVILFDGEPQTSGGKYLISGSSEKSKWSGPVSWQVKAKLAKEKGAKYVFIITDKTGEDLDKEIRQRAVMARRFSAPTLKPVQENPSGTAAFVFSAKGAAEMLGTSVAKLMKLRSEIDKSGKPASENFANTVSLKVGRVSETIDTENVAAFMEGTDKKDEVLVISAHLDHIGISENGEINNGADDDGSGTVSLLELAEAFSKAKAEGKGPRRSILFLNVTGEEKGLFGSEYYSENPLLPLKNTIADLNIDMIGRVDEAHKNDPRYVYLIGSDKLSSKLHEISEEANKKYVNFKLDYTFNDPKDPNRFYYRSDHYNFAKMGVPVIFYFTGVHEDYHRPGDDVEKILFDKQSEIVKLVFYTAWDLVNRDERIVVDSHKE
ncbi:M28 family peptidase [Dyadobacter jiangsuensis]|uniref:Zn-dependent M28 family amino/carboxypeptidase n=1 Tax=Dyadobacter jiangsuensis TaxID=1591085 RepID=A0A2P8G5G6_9BACT|nr:M28 family peptidase [Dyadobacter jiangsuensis]PSL29220.1 Zn-dependent M28 family amino/carboxypeptidase [Dyadobacter jiangsuensis]